ncbi:hypothetical protein HDU76_007157 [Blyttiomyces sp. JEL0837]|nr:hypothetical protein HDU76_007157 [Blyttiomyces sp. JEL0837]
MDDQDVGSKPDGSSSTSASIPIPTPSTSVESTPTSISSSSRSLSSEERAAIRESILLKQREARQVSESLPVVVPPPPPPPPAPSVDPATTTTASSLSSDVPEILPSSTTPSSNIDSSSSSLKNNRNAKTTTSSKTSSPSSPTSTSNSPQQTTSPSEQQPANTTSLLTRLSTSPSDSLKLLLITIAFITLSTTISHRLLKLLYSNYRSFRTLLEFVLKKRRDRLQGFLSKIVKLGEMFVGGSTSGNVKRAVDGGIQPKLISTSNDNSKEQVDGNPRQRLLEKLSAMDSIISNSSPSIASLAFEQQQHDQIDPNPTTSAISIPQLQTQKTKQITQKLAQFQHLLTTRLSTQIRSTTLDSLKQSTKNLKSGITDEMVNQSHRYYMQFGSSLQSGGGNSGGGWDGFIGDLDPFFSKVQEIRGDLRGLKGQLLSRHNFPMANVVGGSPNGGGAGIGYGSG